MRRDLIEGYPGQWFAVDESGDVVADELEALLERLVELGLEADTIQRVPGRRRTALRRAELTPGLRWRRPGGTPIRISVSRSTTDGSPVLRPVVPSVVAPALPAVLGVLDSGSPVSVANADLFR